MMLIALLKLDLSFMFTVFIRDNKGTI